MNKISCYNGILYKIEYKPELSQKEKLSLWQE